MPYEDYPTLEDVSVDRDAMLDRVWVHLNDLTVNPDTRLYFYSALELRFFIESLFFELLAHFKADKLTQRDFKVYRPKDFSRLLTSLHADWATQAPGVLGVVVTEDDLQRMMTLYGELGSCLHLPKEPFFLEDQEGWKLQLETKVIRAYKYLERFSRDPTGRPSS